MLDLNLVPERSLGCDKWEFRLGMHFSQAVAIIQSQISVIRDVQVIYSDLHPLDLDLIINMPNDGLRLVFDPVVQRLKIIEIYNMKLIKLKYNNHFFNSPEVLPSIEQIEHSFGATHPGTYDSENEMFIINFRGLAFYFPLAKHQINEQGLQYGHNLMTIDGNSLVTCTIIYSGASDLSEAIVPELPQSCYHGLFYLNDLEVLRTQYRTLGVRVRFKALGNISDDGSTNVLDDTVHKIFERDIFFGDSCQDVMSAIGSPSKIFFKSEDKMRIHSPNAHERSSNQQASDYFYNYFTMGIDILFDANTHCVKKFLLHTNYPGHYNFNVYHRCEFILNVHSDHNNQQLIAIEPSIQITPYTKWNDLTTTLKITDKPVVLNRTSSTNTTNPFGSTLCYGYQDMIFEVMQNNYIASVTFYCQPDMN